MKSSMTPRDDGVGLYLHVPFCDRRCHFCGFFTRARREDRVAAFVSHLLAGIQLHGRTETLRRRAVETIYFRGGKPPPPSLRPMRSHPGGRPRTLLLAPTPVTSL